MDAPIYMYNDRKLLNLVLDSPYYDNSFCVNLRCIVVMPKNATKNYWEAPLVPLLVVKGSQNNGKKKEQYNSSRDSLLVQSFEKCF